MFSIKCHDISNSFLNGSVKPGDCLLCVSVRAHVPVEREQTLRNVNI